MLTNYIPSSVYRLILASCSVGVDMPVSIIRTHC